MLRRVCSSISALTPPSLSLDIGLRWPSNPAVFFPQADLTQPELLVGNTAGDGTIPIYMGVRLKPGSSGSLHLCLAELTYFPMGLLTALPWLLEKDLSFLRFFSSGTTFYYFPASLVLTFQISAACFLPCYDTVLVKFHPFLRVFIINIKLYNMIYDNLTKTSAIFFCGYLHGHILEKEQICSFVLKVALSAFHLGEPSWQLCCGKDQYGKGPFPFTSAMCSSPGLVG